MTEDDVLTFKQLREIRQREKDEDMLQELDEGFVVKAKDYLERKKRTSSGISTEYVNAKHTVEDVIDTRRKKLLRLAFLSTKTNLRVENLLPEEEKLFDDLVDMINSYTTDMNARVFPDVEDPSDMSGEDEGLDEQAVEQDEGEEGVPGASDKDATADDSADDAGAAEDEEEVGREEAVAGEREDKLGGVDDSEEGSEGSEVLFGGSDDPGEEEEQVEEGMERIRFLGDVGSFVGSDMESYGPFVKGEEAVVPEENAAVLVDDGDAERC